jgi:hypothetical protein
LFYNNYRSHDLYNVETEFVGDESDLIDENEIDVDELDVDFEDELEI